MEHSDPELFDGSNNELETTLSGAPCNLSPPLSDDDLRQKYFGCQNVPSVLWFRLVASSRKHNNGSSGQQSKSFLSPNINLTETNLTKRRSL